MTQYFMFFFSRPDFAVFALLIPVLFVRYLLVSTNRLANEWLLLAAIFVIPGELLAALIALSISKIRPFKFDLYVYQFDAALGNPAFRLGQLAARHLWVANFFIVTYDLICTSMIFTFAVTLAYLTQRDALRVIVAFSLNLFMAVPIYVLFPVCGPSFS